MTMLPDVDETGYGEWQNQLFTEDADRKIEGLGFAHQANSQIADLSRIGVWAEAPTPEGPPPPPAPQAVPEAPPEAVVSAAPAAVPEQSPPVRTTALSPSPAAGPSPVPARDWQNQVFGQALGVVEQAGGDVQRFADDFSGRLASATDANSIFGAALNAADRAGADVQAFASSFQPPEPSVAPSVAPSVTGGGPAPVPGGPLQDYARQAALKAGVDPDIFVRQIQQESGFNPNARSPAGAQGIAQFMPGTAKGMGVDVTDPYSSLEGAARLMANHLEQYGGDYSKALAAYNAGPGNVAKYGGVPPFEETQRYVSTILGGTSPGREAAPAEGISRAGGALGQANRDISQFGDPQLTNDEAYAACGPAAAVRFAQRFGRNPSLREATDLAASVGWTSAQGMAGLSSEKALMDKLGVPTKLVSGADWGTFANEARTGNPVTISTQGHYFTADGWDPNTNRFHVGRSGLDLKGGSEWMTPEQMTAIMGPVQGGLLADNPQVPAPSVADQDTNPAGWLDRTRKTMADSLSGAGNVLQQGIIEPLRGALSLESAPEPHDLDTARLDASVMQAASVPGGTRALPEIAGVQAPGGGYDPSSLSAVTEAPQPGVPLRQDVRDLGGQQRTSLPLLGGLSDLIEQGRQELPPPTTGPSGEPVPDIGAGLGAAGRELERQRAEERDLTSASAYIPGGAADAGGVLSAYLRGTGVYPEDEGVEAPLIGRIGRPELAGALANVAIPSGAEEAFGTGASRTFTAAERAARRAAAPPGLVDVAGDVARRGAGEVYTRGVEAAERVFPPETAYAMSRETGERMAGEGAPLSRFTYGQADRLGADGLYHQTSVRDAVELLGASQGGPGGEVWVSPFQDLALGQGGKGALVEFAPSDKLWVQASRSKPSSQFVEAERGLPPEMLIRRSDGRGADTIRAITIQPDAPMDRVARAQVKNFLRDWPQETLEDGSVRYTNPRLQAPEPATTGAPVAAAPEAPVTPREVVSEARAKPGTTVTGETETGRVSARFGEAPPGEPPPPRPPSPPPPPGGPGRGDKIVDDTLDMYERADRQPPLKDRVTQGLQDLASGLDRNVADRNAAVNQMTQRARKALGPDFTPDMDAEVFLSTLMGRGGAALQRLRDHINPATRLVGREDWDNLNAYRKFQRDLEVANLRGGERAASAGVATAEDAQEGLLALERRIGPKRWARLQRADQMVQDGLNQLLRDKMDAGLVDRELGEKLLREHPHYNPTVFLKFLGEDVFSGASVGADRATVNSNLLRRLAEVGSTDDTEKPIRSATRQLVQGEALIDRNLAAQAIVKAAQADPEMAGLIKRVPDTRLATGPLVSPKPGEAGQDLGTIVGRMFGDRPGTISVFEDGKRVLYSIPPEIEQVVKNMDSTQTGFLIQALQAANAPLRVGATIASIPFQLRNLVGDAVTTYVREGAGTAARIPMGWWSAARQNDLYRGYMRAGGGMESIFQRSPQDLDKLVRESGGIVASTPGELANLINPMRLLQRAGEVIEQGPRLATFERHLAAGATPREAAMAGRRVTVDFARGGEAVRQANAALLFLNARVQGALNVPRTLRDNPASRVRAGTVAAMAAGAYAWNRQPEFREAYADVPDDVKDSSMVWMLPGSVRNEGGKPGFKELKYIAIPTREWASFTAPVNYALSKFDQENQYDDRPWQDFAKSYARNFGPFSGEDVSSVTGSFLPAPVRTPVELATNTRWYSGMPIVSRELEGLPESQQANERTSLLAKALGDRFGISPQQIDFVISENLGGAGRTAVQGIGAALDTPLGREAAGIPPEITAPTEGQQNPLVSGILQSRGGQLQQRQYERKEGIESAQSEATRRWVQSLPEYQTATPDGKQQMLLIAQQQVEETASERVGIQPQIRDIGLPPKYLGIKDPEKQRQVEEAVAAYRAWEADPKNAPKPSPEQLKLGVPYSDPEMIDPRWTIANARLQERNRRIRRGAAQQTEAVPVP